MTSARNAELLEILQQHFNPREDGWIWLALYVDGRDGGLVNQIEGEYEDVDESAAGLAHIINADLADEAHLALCRPEGRPTERDRELWRAVRARTTPSRLTDMVVFNRTQLWSMRAEDAEARV